MTRGSDSFDASCVNCSRPAVAGRECVRAMALMCFSAIARHPEAGTDCKLCEQGCPIYCGDCFVGEVASYRALLRDAGNPVVGDRAGGSRIA